MKSFRCACGQTVFFSNSHCLNCGAILAFSFVNASMETLQHIATPENARVCANREEHHCNWLVEPGDPNDECLACRLNFKDSIEHKPSTRKMLIDAEEAKRRLLYTLSQFGLPVIPRSEHPKGIAFILKESAPGQPVTTGHADGLITLDLKEADASERERVRIALGEKYRTTLGHFRHESGHYYWTLLFENPFWLAKFREVFGDETQDYQTALQKHYRNPIRTSANHVSSYATSHPWEDWAETWAHVLHIHDSWETAVDRGLVTPKKSYQDQFMPDIETWIELMVNMNALNRSMGHADYYPFHTTEAVKRKLQFVQTVILARASEITETLTPAPPPQTIAPVN